MYASFDQKKEEKKSNVEGKLNDKNESKSINII